MSTSATNFGPVKITETVLRDAHQSLLATRMRTEQMLPMLSALDKIGYNALEAWGGATYDSCLRFLNEDPWERLDTLKANLNTPIQMLLRGQNLLGYNHYSDDVVRAFVRKASEHGVGVFRIFDALNDVTNLKTAISAALEAKEKPHVQGCLVYTISPFHTNQTFVDLAIKLKEMGVHSICIKDMSGLLKPYVAEDLVKKLKSELDEFFVRMIRGDRVDEAALDVRMLRRFERGGDGDFQVADIVERIEDAEHADAVLRRFRDEFFHDVIRIMVVAEEVLAAEQHLNRRLQMCFQRIETLPRIFIEEAEAGVERCAAPSLEGLIADLVECFELREHVLDAHARRTERLMAIAEDGLHDFYGFCHDKTLQCSNNF